MASPTISISMKGLAKYMTATPTSARKVLRDFKYPDDEGLAQAMYYREARDRIAAFHRGGSGVAWLHAEADDLETLAVHSSGPTRTRLNHNAAALREYAGHFGARAFEPLADERLELWYGQVRVRVAPDLVVSDGGRSKVIKLEFARDEPASRVIAIISQLMFEAASARGLVARPADALYLDVARGKVHRAARRKARLARDIEATCKNIEAIWPTL